MSRGDALEIVRRLLDAGQRRDVSALLDCYVDDAVAISPVFGEVQGRQHVVETWEKIFSTLPDIDVRVSDVLVDGNRLAVLSTITAIDRTGWFGLPATGSAINYRLVLLLTLRDGKIARDERLYDSTGVLERLEKARLDAELRTASEVQRTLLPHCAHVTPFCESVGDSIPCRAIGGDFFEFISLPAGDLGIAMGDVAGKGPAAALVAAMLQGMLVTEAPAGGGPADILTRMNRRLVARLPAARYATVVYAVLSSNGRLVYSNGGHNPPLIHSGGAMQRLCTGGPILGMFENATFAEETLRLNPRDTLVLFTDGVTEARSATDQEFGEDRLLAAVRANAAEASASMLQRIIAAVREFSDGVEQNDDITVAITRMQDVGGPRR